MELDCSWQGSQATTPNNAPTPAVKAIAKAPQKVTRAAAVITEAPPARAAREPNSARNRSELPETAHMSADSGTNRTIKRGRTAPTEKVTADANAACTGRAVDVADIPSSSRPCAPRA